MNIDTIQNAFNGCTTETMAYWLHGLYTGRAIEKGSFSELGATIDQLREDALARIKKTQYGASEEAGGVSSHE